MNATNDLLRILPLLDRLSREIDRDLAPYRRAEEEREAREKMAARMKLQDRAREGAESTRTPEFDSAEAFAAYLEEDERSTYTRGELARLVEQTKLDRATLVRDLRARKLFPGEEK